MTVSADVFDEKYGQELTIDRPGCTVHAWLAGRADAPLVALRHAALVDHTFFSRQVPALLPRYRVLTRDIRGHGASRPLKGAFTIPDSVDDLVAILDRLEVERAVMLGQSMGSYVAQEMAYRHADRVAALIVIGGTCITEDPGTLGREELEFATPIMRAWPYRSLKNASVKAAAVEGSSRAYLRHRFDEGDFSLDRHGDMTRSPITVTRMAHGREVADRVIFVPSRLVD